jgi:hypothetical protein
LAGVGRATFEDEASVAIAAIDISVIVYVQINARMAERGVDRAAAIADHA